MASTAILIRPRRRQWTVAGAEYITTDNRKIETIPPKALAYLERLAQCSYCQGRQCIPAALWAWGFVPLYG